MVVAPFARAAVAPDILMIVNRDERALYSYVHSRFAGEPVEILFDRRQHGERRQQRTDAPGVERRQTDRRTHRIDDRLKSQGWVVVRCDRHGPVD